HLFVRVLSFLSFFFFFQAEDGIRDFHVTGVQTCALPIFQHFNITGFAIYTHSNLSSFLKWIEIGLANQATTVASQIRLMSKPARSEERSVGKECRSRWSPEQ